ncbi:iron-sulfur cluster-binding domain-containing protein [Vibrio cholerae]|uniref:iron-sulfur cluster-binding domain-containing protein n=1 Tax=Vibrio cholerae TaxID=666 RepID=UPI0031F520C0|nr:iron-sulfur cluster-binding domain-containing protein [Vibrio cholerae]
MKLQCVNIHHETVDKSCYTFSVVDSYHNMAIFPGCHINLKYQNIDGSYVSRSYTVIEIHNQNTFSIIVKRTGNSGVSDALYQNLKNGDILESEGFFGLSDFSIFNGKKNILMISGGVGITLPYALINEMSWYRNSMRILHCHSEKRILDIPRIQQLLFFNETIKTYDLKLYLTDANHSDYENAYNGRISINDISYEYKPDLIMICGSANFSLCLVEQCKKKFPSASIYVESFGGSEKLVINNAESQPVKVTYNGVDIRAKEGENLLGLLENNNLKVKSKCRSGICGSCVVRVKAGCVRRDPDFCLSEDDIANGLVLSCVSYCQSKILEIESF